MLKLSNEDSWSDADVSGSPRNSSSGKRFTTKVVHDGISHENLLSKTARLVLLRVRDRFTAGFQSVYICPVVIV
jgi:hypothetical protein